MVQTELQRPEQQAVAEHKAATASSPLVPRSDHAAWQAAKYQLPVPSNRRASVMAERNSMLLQLDPAVHEALARRASDDQCRPTLCSCAEPTRVILSLTRHIIT